MFGDVLQVSGPTLHGEAVAATVRGTGRRRLDGSVRGREQRGDKQQQQHSHDMERKA